MDGQIYLVSTTVAVKQTALWMARSTLYPQQLLQNRQHCGWPDLPCIHDSCCEIDSIVDGQIYPVSTTVAMNQTALQMTISTLYPQQLLWNRQHSGWPDLPCIHNSCCESDSIMDGQIYLVSTTVAVKYTALWMARSTLYPQQLL